MLTYLLVAVAVGAIIKLWYDSISTGLSSIPGPFLARYTNLWRTYYQRRGEFHKVCMDLQKKYGDIVRVAPKVVMVCDTPEILDEAWGFGAKNLPKSDMMKPWIMNNGGVPMPSIVSAKSKETHAKLRKPFASAYTNSSIVAYEQQVDETIRFLLKRLDEEFISGSSFGKPCPIHDWVQFFAFDIIGQICLSRGFGFLEEGRDIDDMLRLLEVETDYRAWVGTIPWLDDYLRKNPIYKLISNPSNPFIEKSRSIIGQRIASDMKSDQSEAAKSDTKPDLLHRFIEIKQNNPDTVDDWQLASVTALNLLAGSDTTAVSMRAIIYHTLRHPKVKARLVAEIDKNVTKYPVSQVESHEQLPYLDAVIRESLRVHGIAPFLLERELPPSGLTLPSGQKLPRNAIVGITAWTMHFNEKIYGKDAKEFKPERWLKQEGESDQAYKERMRLWDHVDFSFSFGPRVCLGKHIARLEMYKLIPTLFGLFDIELAKPEQEWIVKGMFFTKQSNMDVVLKWRQGVNCEKILKG